MAMNIGSLVAMLGLDTSPFEDSAKGVGAKLPGWIGTAGSVAAGVAAALSFSAAFQAAVNMEAGNDKVAAQLGLTEEEAQRAGDAAASAYGNAFGDSLETVQGTTAGVISSIRGMRDASVDELQGIVQGVQGMSDAFGIEADRISQVVGQMLSTGLASSAQEGLDLLTAALQKVPAAVREDVMDAADEYGPFFATIGMSGEDAMAALVNASEKGMYGIDKTGDAVKELSIRATDMSTTSIAAYEAAGLNAEEMAGKILAGGDTAKEGFNQIVNGLLGIEDPTARANAAIGLFGTPLEDLGVTEIPRFLDSLINMEGGLGDVEGATQRMTDTMGGNVASTWDSFTRQVGLLGSELGTKLLPLIQPVLDALVIGVGAVSPVMLEMADALGSFMETSGLAVPIIAGLGAALLAALAPAIWGAVTATWAFTTALLANPITWIVVGIGLLVAAIVWLVMNWDTAVAWITEVWSGFMSWLGDVMAGFGTWWTEMWAGFGSWVQEVWSGFTSWVQSVFEGFVGWLTGIGDGIAAWWNGLWAGIGAWIQSVWTGFTNWVRSVFTGWVGWLMGIGSGVASWWNGLWSGIGSFFQGLWNGLVSWAISVVSAWLSGWRGIFSGLSGFFSGLWNGIVTTIQNAWNGAMSFLQSIPDRIMGFFSGIGSWLINAGEDLIQGFIDGIGNMIGAVGDAVGNVMDFVGGFFPHSPAKRGPFSGSGWTQLLDSGAAIMLQFTDGMRGQDPFSDDRIRAALSGDWGSPAPAPVERVPASETHFTYVAAENQSLSSEEALFAALGSPRSPFGGIE